MKTLFRVLILVVVFLGVMALRAATMSSAFSYTGRLQENGAAANGSYDLRAALFDAEVGGNQVGLEATNSQVAVNSGLFTTAFDFGETAFDGAARWLELSVRTNGSMDFVLLTPRQPVLAVPYSLYAPAAGQSRSAASADTVAANAV